jgi:hypothetical protein
MHRCAFPGHLPSLDHTVMPDPALNLAPFSRWTLRDKTAQRHLVLR